MRQGLFIPIAQDRIFRLKNHMMMCIHSLKNTYWQPPMFRNSRNSEVNDTDISWPLWRLQSSKWQRWISNPNLIGMPMSLLFPVVLKTLSMSHAKSYSTWRWIRSRFLYSMGTLTAPARPSLVHLHSCRMTVTRAESPSVILRWEVFKNCYWNRSSLCVQSTRSDPKTFPSLSWERPFPGSPPLLVPIQKVCQGVEGAHGFRDDWLLQLSGPHHKPVLVIYYCVTHNPTTQQLLIANI